jgi:hypothetical protein
MSGPVSPEINIAIRTLIALVYAAAALGKMRHWGVFQGVVANYRLLPDFLVAPVTYGLPPVEAVLALALLLGVWSPWPELAAAALLLVFAMSMGINLRRGRAHIDCGCFQSALKQPLRWIFVVRNGVLALLLGVALWSRAGSADVRMTVEGLLVGGVLFLILQSLNILWSIVPSWHRPTALGSEATP